MNVWNTIIADTIAGPVQQTLGKEKNNKDVRAHYTISYYLMTFFGTFHCVVLVPLLLKFC